MRSVLVTGGTRRLGAAIAAHLRTRGWRVLTSSHRPEAGADLVADLSEPGGAARLYAATMGLLGGVPPDALVNNAALYTGDAAKVRTVDFEAPQKLTILMAGRETNRGAVVNILDANLPDGATPYRAAKRALAAETVRQAALFAETLRVNAVAPGPVLPPEGLHEKAVETPLGHPTPAAVAAAVAVLLEADYTTGAILPVDGGANSGEATFPSLCVKTIL